MNGAKIRGAFAHGSAILGVAFLVLFVLDRINPAMDFLGSDQTDWLILIFSLTGLGNGVLSAAALEREARAAHRLHAPQEELPRAWNAPEDAEFRRPHAALHDRAPEHSHAAYGRDAAQDWRHDGEAQAHYAPYRGSAARNPRRDSHARRE